MKNINRLFVLTVLLFLGINSQAQTKKDGTADKRYSANKTTKTVPTSTVGTAHTKADGTPDKRYSANKTSATTTPGKDAVTPMAQSAPNTAGATHLKKDGTPDMRYKANRTQGLDKNGTPDKRYKKTSTTPPR